MEYGTEVKVLSLALALFSFSFLWPWSIVFVFGAKGIAPPKKKHNHHPPQPAAVLSLALEVFGAKGRDLMPKEPPHKKKIA
jgi:hypothetical protein